MSIDNKQDIGYSFIRGENMKKYNYYVSQIDRALEKHNPEFNLKIKISGTHDSSNYITLPNELAQYIKNWYYLNADKVLSTKE